MKTILRLFFRTDGINPWGVLLCLLAASLLEGIGVASVIPIISLTAGGPEGDPDSKVLMALQESLGAVGIPLEVRTLVGLALSALLLKALLRFIALRHVGNAKAEFQTRLRARLSRAMFETRWSYLMQRSLGHYVNAVSDLAGRCALGYSSAAAFLSQAIQTVAYTAVSFVVSWQLATFALALGAIMGVSLHFLVRASRTAGARQTRHMNDLVRFLLDGLSSLKPLRAMAKEHAFTDLLDSKIAQLRKAIRKQVRSGEALRGGQEVLVATSLAIVFLVAYQALAVPVVDLLVVGMLLNRTIKGLAKLQSSYQQSATLEVPYLRTMEMISELESQPEPNPGTREVQFQRSIRFRDVSFAYEEDEVLRSISVEIPSNTITVLTGPSGAGKTTLADLILGLNLPDRGELTVDDVPLQEIELRGWRHQIGYVPQELVLFHDTILANVGLGEVGEEEVLRALELAGAMDFVRELPEGIHTLVGHGGARLSGGQRQRIALARSLASRPRLLILDEVTSALDPKTETEICENIRRLSGETTILAITHRPAFFDIADRVYRIEGGRAEEQKPMELAAGA